MAADESEIRRLVEAGASSWTGGRPLASQSRWQAAASRQRQGAGQGLKLAAAGIGFTALIFGSVTMVAVAASPAGTAAMVMRMVSHVFSGEGPPAAPSPGLQPPTRPAAGTLVPSASTSARPLGTARPTPVRGSNWGDDDRARSSPAPSPAPSSRPSPRPSGPPDD